MKLWGRFETVIIYNHTVITAVYYWKIIKSCLAVTSIHTPACVLFSRHNTHLSFVATWLLIDDHCPNNRQLTPTTDCHSRLIKNGRTMFYDHISYLSQPEENILLNYSTSISHDQFCICSIGKLITTKCRIRKSEHIGNTVSLLIFMNTEDTSLLHVNASSRCSRTWCKKPFYEFCKCVSLCLLSVLLQSFFQTRKNATDFAM